MNFLISPKWNLSTSSSRVSAALLALRVLTGFAFILHGIGKIASPFSWMGPDAPIPGIFQAFAAVAEVGGGALLIAGLLTPLASLSLVGTMVGAILFHLGRGDGFVGGYELAAVYLAITGALFLTGPGRYSVDAALAARKGEANLRPASAISA